MRLRHEPARSPDGHRVFATERQVGILGRLEASAVGGERVPRVSIGMPVYNGARYLEAALESILGQSYRDFEVIVSDNASTDATRAICERYAARDGRVRYVRNLRNLGASWNFNRVFALSRGEYFRQAAHDDVLLPTYLERCVAVLDADRSVVVAYPRTLVIDASGAQIAEFRDVLDLREGHPHERLAHFHRRVTHAHAEQGKVKGANADCHPIFGLMRRSDLAGRPGGILPDYVGSDVVLLSEQAQRGRFVEVGESLFLLRAHEESSCSGAFEDAVARAAWFNPSKRARVSNYLTMWRWALEFVRATNRVEMTVGERLRCHLETLRFVGRARCKLGGELVSALLRILRLRPLEPRSLRSGGALS